MLYTINEFMTLIKENIGINDLPMPVDDAELLRRFQTSALREFSARSPRVLTVMMGESERIQSSEFTSGTHRITYRIPKHYIDGAAIMGIARWDVAKPLGYSDYYVPQGSWASPDSVLTALADIKIAASTASAMGKAPTTRFLPPDRIEVYNGWANGTYECDLLLAHDISLSTISPTAFTHLIQLAELDIEEFLYNKLKRLDNLDVGIGNIQLGINAWEGAGSAKRELLKEWDESANLDIDTITYF